VSAASKQLGMIVLGTMGAKHGAASVKKRVPVRRLQSVSNTSAGVAQGGSSRRRFTDGLSRTLKPDPSLGGLSANSRSSHTETVRDTRAGSKPAKANTES